MRFALTAASALMLSACAAAGGLNMVHTVIVDPYFGISEVAVTGAPMPTRVIGAPRDGASLDQTLAALTLPARLGARPARAETPDDFRGLRVVFAYAPLPASRICEADAAGGAAGGGKIGVTEISAALCRGDRQYSYGILRTQAAGPTDPGFRGAVLQLFGAIMPHQTEEFIRPRR